MSRPARDIREAEATETSGGVARVFTDSADHDLVQRRLALFYGVSALAFIGFFLLGALYIAFAMRERFWEIHFSTFKVVHLCTVFVLGLDWLLLRGRPRPHWLLATADLGGATLLMTAAAVMLAFTPPELRFELMGAPVYVFGVALRAALVPSPPRWTAIVSALAAIPAPISAYLATLRDPSWPSNIPRSSPVVVVTGWCIAGFLSALVISRIVYGLRSEVKSAMQLGQYTLENKIGEGGMGTVYRARHALLRRPTAIKLLSPDRAGAVNVKRFEREVQLTSQLTHPNTIAIYDFGHTRDGVFFYAMELIDGLSLQDLCEEDGPQPPGRAIYILAQIAGALAEAHESGLIHRDVKPANILLSSRGGLADFVKVLDFGLVKEVGAVDPALSTANAIAGTPHYMAPESITRPTEIDARVDLYALGGVAYWLLTGGTPFEGANLVEICSHHLHSPPKPPSQLAAAVPASLDALVLRCLAKKAEDRPSSARALATELQDLQEECPWTDDDARAWWTARTKLRTSKAAVVGKS